MALPPDGAAHGLDELRGVLEEWFGRGEDEAWIGLARHRDRAVEAGAAIEEALGLLGEDALELAAFGLGVARTRLGEITGRSTMGAVGEEVLAEIFSRFCIGK